MGLSGEGGVTIPGATRGPSKMRYLSPQKGLRGWTRGHWVGFTHWSHSRVGGGL